MSDETAVKPNTVTRIEWVDIAKGIAIILVMAGHTLRKDGTEAEIRIRNLIYSFHMPLFFILSFLTTSFAKDEEVYVRKVEKDFKRHIIPLLTVFAVQIIHTVFTAETLPPLKEFAADCINMLIFNAEPTLIPDIVYHCFNMMWFILSLFIGKTMFGYMRLRLSEKKLLIAVIVTGCLGAAIGQITYLPFCIDNAMASLPFMYFGYRLKSCSFEKNTVRGFVFCLAVWLAVFIPTELCGFDPIGVAWRIYPLFPLCYVTAAAGTMTVCYISMFLSKLGKIYKPLAFLGRNSIYLYCVHALDNITIRYWTMSPDIPIILILRLAVNIFIAYIVYRAAIIIKQRRKGKYDIQA